MANLRHMLAVAVSPEEALRPRILNPLAPRLLLLKVVSPLASIRAVAELIRSIAVGSFFSGLVLGLGAFILQIGTWLAVSMVLPTLARQLDQTIDDRRAYAMMTYASIPLWAAGILQLAPEEPQAILWWSRLAIFLVSLYGLYPLYLSLGLQDIKPSIRWPLLGLIAVTYVITYGVLFTLLGITSTIVVLIFD